MDARNQLMLKMCMYWWWRRRKINGKRRRIWVRPIFEENIRNRFGASSNLIVEMRLNDQLKYKNFFRMGPTAFEELLRLIDPIIRKVDVHRQPISPSTRLGITLRFLASGDSMTSLSYLFRVGVSTISTIISETTVAIWQTLLPMVLITPNEEVWRSNASGFKETWNFPNCIGALDGKHISIQAPPHAGSEYFNYKGSHSIVLLAVVSDKYTFTVVDIGAQGRQSDGGVLRNSEFGKRLYAQTLQLPASRRITHDGPLLPHVIVADEAFPLLMNLMRPYSSRGGLNLDRNIFNYRLSRARRISENAFGILIARWRIYGQNITGKLDNIENIVKATVCLHNFIMMKHPNTTYVSPRLIDSDTDGVCTTGTWRNYPTDVRSLNQVGTNMHTRNAANVRDEFCRFFNEEGAVPWQWDHI